MQRTLSCAAAILSFALLTDGWAAWVDVADASIAFASDQNGSNPAFAELAEDLMCIEVQ